MANNEIVIEVRIDEIEAPRTGVSRQGNNYYIQGYRSTIVGFGAKQLHFDVMGEDRNKMMQLQVGRVYKIWLDLSSRQVTTQSGGTMWHNDVRVYMATPI